MWVHPHACIWYVVGMSDTLVMKWTLRSVAIVIRIAPWSMGTLRILGSVLLHILNSFQLRSVSWLILLWSKGLKLAWASVSFTIKIIIAFKRTFSCIILAHQILLQYISIVWIFGSPHKMIEIGLKCFLSFIFRYFLRVNFF